MYTDTEHNISFDSIRIGLASPDKIRQWTRGEVRKPETINYRTLKPERDGLFCERIFGPNKDWECHCGKYKRIRHKGVVCERCGVEVTKKKVRRERMGHIELAAPVSHIWYFRGIPSRMGIILGMSPRNLENILYFVRYVVLETQTDGVQVKQLLTDTEYREALEKLGPTFRVGMGAEAIKELLTSIDLEKEHEELSTALLDAKGQKKSRTIRKLEVIEAFRQSGNRPEWMILDVLPVIPPDLRPMVQLDGGRFATSDLNDLYRRVINRNNRLKRLLDLGAPGIIVRNEKRMLQESVDALIDNGRRGRPVTGPGNRPLKSLSDLLKGKQGRFRQNLLGKRVDYSGRSVIVVGPELKFYQCGLPKEMAIELFKPFVMKKLCSDGIAHNIKYAKRMVERMQPEVWDVLEEVIKDHPVLLNRAPTLHRLGIQAFEPILVEGKAIKLHPLACMAYNADFDGDQMAVHVPLSVEAQAECRVLMLSPNNLLKPSDGAPVSVPDQDIVLGIYYLTSDKKGEPGEGRAFKDEEEALMAYDKKDISLHAKVRVRRSGEIDGKPFRRLVETTVGRIIFNEVVPQDLGLVDRSLEENYLEYEVHQRLAKKDVADLIRRCINKYDSKDTVALLDNLKHLGFKYSTLGAMTVSISDIKVPPQKGEIIAEADKKISEITKMFRRGHLTDEERHEKVIEIWGKCADKVTEALLNNLDENNNIYMMAQSGARGSIDQIKQLGGMRGLVVSPTGSVIELPVKSNYKEGLSVLEYFSSAHGARKGLADTALKTADSGYLTRRLVDVSQHIIIREWDCVGEHEEKPYMTVSAFDDKSFITSDDGMKEVHEEIEPLRDRISGRFAVGDIKHPETGDILVFDGAMISSDEAKEVEDTGVTEVNIRTVLTCRSRSGLCARCYGSNMASGNMVRVGESIGIIAAQSIGEPGTQLTMKTFHLGGIASNDDITQGLTRVEELFEARKPKGVAIIAEFPGKVEMTDDKKKREVIISNNELGEEKAYLIPYGSRTKVVDGEWVEAGEELTEGSVYPHDILNIKGLRGVQDYILKEVHRVYRLHGVDINDKHIEVIVRQMLQRVEIEERGDSSFLLGSLIDWLEFDETNQELIEQGLEPAQGKRVLLGITKASLATDSFLSAASFQETTRVLTEAAIKGKVDYLTGLKENVIIGKLIPAGTGMPMYRKIGIRTKHTKLGNSEFLSVGDQS